MTADGARRPPHDVEVAAVVAALAVLAAERSAPPADPPAPPRSAWADPARLVRASSRPGPDRWRRP